MLCRPNHGLMTMYEFGETIGGLERCYYFGHGKDLYHFDHFLGEHNSRAVGPLARICNTWNELLHKHAEHSNLCLCTSWHQPKLLLYTACSCVF